MFDVQYESSIERAAGGFLLYQAAIECFQSQSTTRQWLDFGSEGRQKFSSG
jgi:hypothetical protein